MTTDSLEEWRDVVDFEGIYMISSLGRVISLDRIDAQGRNWPGRMLTVTKGHGYPFASLWKDGKGYARRIHRLILDAFVGPRPSGMVACHNDGDLNNSALSNLRWDTQSENLRDQVRHGTHPHSSRSTCTRGHRLDPANLCRAEASKGVRKCLACERARAARRRAGLDGIDQEEADAYYAKIAGAVHA